MIPDDIKERIDFVISFVETSLVDWIPIKMQIVSSLKKEQRSIFSSRHQRTKKIHINDFEREIMAYWKEQTGITPIINPSKLQDPAWVGKTRKDNFTIINAERKLKRQQQNELNKRAENSS